MPMFCSTVTVTVTRTYYASPYYVNTLLFTRYTINKRWFSVLRVARFGNGITVTLFYTSQESVSRLCLKAANKNSHIKEFN